MGSGGGVGVWGVRIAVDVCVPCELSAKAWGGKGGSHVVIFREQEIR